MILDEYKPIIKKLTIVFLITLILFVIFIVWFCEVSGGWF